MVLASIISDPHAFARSDSYTIILGLLVSIIISSDFSSARFDSRQFILGFGIFLEESIASARCLFFLDDPTVNGLGNGFPSDSFPSHGNFCSLVGGIRTHN
ncbi:hypothetical protein C4D60_Mb10t10390 [Musa balbisiana]|uniref:Uncharacterized protein n=1 Tax=Musa balbisiana TaxID=52838 RepID=A0A4S8IXF7_MUSBA|nr:hypothetical protein C4D60_Mb10t10390 [Musa balbisiana]